MIFLTNGFPGWAIALIVSVLILVLLVILIAWWISTSNWFRRQQVAINNAASSIDVALNKRFDLLTKEREIVIGYAKHEASTLQNVVASRAKDFQDRFGKFDANKLAEYNKQLDAFSVQLRLLIERYPDLKADQNFLALQATTADVEDQLQGARRAYNSIVAEYNQNLVTFPKSIVAKHLKLEEAKFFQVEEGKRTNPEMKF